MQFRTSGIELKYGYNSVRVELYLALFSNSK